MFNELLRSLELFENYFDIQGAQVQKPKKVNLTDSESL